MTQEEKIDLSNLGDEDLISIDKKIYKAAKLKGVIEDLSKATRFYVGTIAHQYKAFDLGLVIFDKSWGSGSFSLPREFIEDGFNYKFIKLGFPGWQTGLFKLSTKTYLSLSDNEQESLMTYYSFSGIDFEDEDVLSFKEDVFCTGLTVKDIFQKVFEDAKFYEKCSSIFAQPIPELTNFQSFLKYGKKIQFLKIETAKWETATLRVSFDLETRTNLAQKPQSVEFFSPLDEIRNNIV